MKCLFVWEYDHLCHVLYFTQCFSECFLFVFVLKAIYSSVFPCFCLVSNFCIHCFLIFTKLSKRIVTLALLNMFVKHFFWDRSRDMSLWSSSTKSLHFLLLLHIIFYVNFECIHVDNVLMYACKWVNAIACHCFMFNLLCLSFIYFSFFYHT